MTERRIVGNEKRKDEQMELTANLGRALAPTSPATPPTTPTMEAPTTQEEGEDGEEDEESSEDEKDEEDVSSDDYSAKPPTTPTMEAPTTPTPPTTSTFMSRNRNNNVSYIKIYVIYHF